ncbi:lactate utilization protein C [Streptomyces sp. NPDC051018]|uniref:lactate utilization protein C n=1 Tax=Streptomyces sp. NPDC051018 TaxID=3365639 RepID=UPI0037A75BBE
MSSRDRVLARIRNALTDIPATETPESVGVPRNYLRSHAGADRVALFAERVADYHATVVRTTEDRAPAVVGDLLAARRSRTVVVPEGFPAALLPDRDGGYLRDDPPLTVRELDAADTVLTTAALGIAVTGTLVLDAGPGQGRRALTLLPDHHVCVVHEEQIAADVPEALARLNPTAPLTFVSGPSATSDIELERVEGVHGPRVLDVVVVAANPAEGTGPDLGDCGR